jgi:hypothetical protein
MGLVDDQHAIEFQHAVVVQGQRLNIFGNAARDGDG